MTHEYIGTKIVTAWPAEKDGQPGYAVKYADGYTSWSPREAFEAAYVDIGHVAHLPPHQQRVIGEAAALVDKIDKLQTFTSTPVFKALPGPERDLLHVQFTAMRKYLRALEQRIDRFGIDHAS
ncbi:MAG: crAss001_48 related protein [Lysobacter sp.]